jgi:D-3-phosphoglycerate dehydrogenase / 2-oxoglutarate reductase
MQTLLCPEPDNFSNAGLEFASRHFQTTLRQMDQAEFDRLAPDFDCVLVRFNTLVGPNVMKDGSRIKAVLSPTTGLDHLDLVLARKQKIKVLHLKGRKAFLRTISATAELAVTLMLALLRRLPEARQTVLDGKWQPVRGHEASGRTLGIVGYGRLGRKVAAVGRALGMHVMVYDAEPVKIPKSFTTAPSLNFLLSKADIASFHVPLDQRSHMMIGEENLLEMKPGALIINTSRGDIIDSSALLAALETGHIGGAGVDVIDNEHSILSRSNPLIEYARKHANLIITPHMGGSTFEAIEKTDLFILNAAVEWLNRENK